MTIEEKKSRVAEIEKEIGNLYRNKSFKEKQNSFDWYVKNIKPLSDEQRKLQNEIEADRQLNVKVGEGITISCWTDCMAYTVIARTPKTITIQRDKAIRTDNNGMSDCQSYKYKRDKKGHTRVMRFSKKYGCWVDGTYHGYIGRREYYDYSF